MASSLLCCARALRRHQLLELGAVRRSFSSASSSATAASGLDGLDPYFPGEAGHRPRAPHSAWVDTVRAEQLLAARVHLGHQRRKTHRAVTGQLYGFRHNVAVFDINKTWRSMRTLFYAFAEMAAQRSTFFLLAPNPNLPLEPLIEKMRAEYPFRYDRFNSLYMLGYSDKKWSDGLFSNWKVTVEYARHVQEVLAGKPGLAKYRRLRRALRGVEELDAFSRIHPDFVLVLAPDRGAFNEVRIAELPMVGVVDSDEDPRPFLYPVFANNDSVESVQFVLDLIKRGVEEGRRREQEAFALLLVRKIKAYLDPHMGTGAALIEPEEPAELSRLRGLADAEAWRPTHPRHTRAERPAWLDRVRPGGRIEVPKA